MTRHFNESTARGVAVLLLGAAFLYQAVSSCALEPSLHEVVMPPSKQPNPHGEPVNAKDLKLGSVYFSVTYLDEAAMIPILEPLVFVGKNLNEGDKQRLYFQDVPSYSLGIRFDSSAESSEHENKTDESNTANMLLFDWAEEDIEHIFEYEQALEVLRLCSARRSKQLRRMAD